MPVPFFYSSVHIPTRGITRLMNLEGNPPSDFRDTLTNCASAPTDATEEFFEYDAEEFLVFLTLLITEGRTPEYSVKGRTEGLHCPPAQSAMPPLHRHECSDKLPQVLFERTLAQHFSACTTRCVSCWSVDRGGLQARLFFLPLAVFFYFWHQAFTDASLSNGMHLWVALRFTFCNCTSTAGTEPRSGSRHWSFQLLMFCFPVTAYF